MNDKLRELVASLRPSASGSRPASRRCPDRRPQATRRTSPSISRRSGSPRELALAREAVAHANEGERLRLRLAEIEAENQRICDEYVAVQEKSTDLAQLYVALERIHGGLSRADTSRRCRRS